MPVDPPQYPVNLVVEGRPCLVVGGGAVAARKVAGLLACGAVVTVVAPEVGEEIESWALSGRIALARRRYEPNEVVGYRLVIAATDDHAVN
ncbi:MAG TPA: NAD(P)-dependent oxidoreductase, partial [Acidimicrobiales bacterium]|nr:NAD(P)-dependent oxidoreductase [Acidimicrobiales bacterium]